jgi:hypothetical protein
MFALMSTVLMACTSIPSSGPVNSTDRTAGLETSEVDFLAAGAIDRATPEEIIAGFVAAGTAAQDNYRVARSYLAQEVREDSGTPTRRCSFDEGEPLISDVLHTLRAMWLPVVASVDELGRYSTSPSVSSQTLDFRLVEEDDEWRISGLSRWHRVDRSSVR